MKTKAERITALIGDEKSPFTAEDQATLEALTEDQITTLEGQDRAGRIKALVNGSLVAPAPKPAVVETPAPTVAAAAAPKVLTEAQFLDTVPEGMLKDSLKEGLRVGKEKHANTIKALKATGRCAFTDEQLAAKPQAELDNLLALAGGQATDFGGLGAPKVGDSKDAVPAPPDFVKALSEKRAAERK